MVSVTDDQHQALEELSRKRHRSTAQLTREALDAWLAVQPQEEVAQAS